jgi:hypothetical protein
LHSRLTIKDMAILGLFELASGRSPSSAALEVLIDLNNSCAAIYELRSAYSNGAYCTGKHRIAP